MTNSSFKKEILYSSGRYFFKDILLSNENFHFYRYTGDKKEKIIGKPSHETYPLYVVLEPSEITFGYYSKKERSIISAKLFSISLDQNLRSSDQVGNKFERAFNEIIPLNINGEFNTKDFFRHFLIDLYVYNLFAIEGKNDKVKTTFEEIKVIQGFIYRTLFFYYNEFKIDECFDKNGNIRFSIAKASEKQRLYSAKYSYYYDKWIGFLTSRSNLDYFHHDATDMGERDPLEYRTCFDSLNKEIIKIEKAIHVFETEVGDLYFIEKIKKIFSPIENKNLALSTLLLVAQSILVGIVQLLWYILNPIWILGKFTYRLILKFWNNNQIKGELDGTNHNYLLLANSYKAKYNLISFLLGTYDISKALKIYAPFKLKIIASFLKYLILYLLITISIFTFFSSVDEGSSQSEYWFYYLVIPLCFFLAIPSIYLLYYLYIAFFDSIFSIKRNKSLSNHWNNKFLENRDFLTDIQASFPVIFLPRLSIAIFSGWVIFISAEEILKVDVSIDPTTVIFISIILIAILIAFLYAEIKSILRKFSDIIILKRVVQVIGISFLISYSIGFFVMSYISERFLSVDSFMASENQVKLSLQEDLISTEELLNKIWVYKNALRSRTNTLEKRNEIVTKRQQANLLDWSYTTTKRELKIPINISQDDLAKMARFIRVEHAFMRKEHELIFKALQDSNLKSRIKSKDASKYHIYRCDKKDKGLNQILSDIEDLFKFEQPGTDYEHYTVCIDCNNITELDSIARHCRSDCTTSYNKILDLESSLMRLRKNLNKERNKDWSDWFNRHPKCYGTSFISPKEINLWPFGEEKDTQQGIEPDHPHLHVFPGLIFLRSILAIFIGIFLQLVLQNNTVTDPL